MRPFVELSFMPSALASGTTTVFNYEANITPRDYGVVHVDRTARITLRRALRRREVSEWFFEVWNEPNLTSFWDGTQRDYFKLYRHTAEAIKKIDAAFRVGGPATAKSDGSKTSSASAIATKCRPTSSARITIQTTASKK